MAPPRWRDADPVAVAPDAGVHVEVAVVVAAVACVAPEVQRHRRHRLRAHQLADLVDQRPADAVCIGLGPGLDAGAEAAALHLAFDHRQRRQAADEGAGEVGAAGDRREPDVLAVDLGQLVPDPAVAVLGQRRAGGADGAQRRQLGHCLRLDAGLQARRIEGRAGAEEGAARQRRQSATACSSRAHRAARPGCRRRCRWWCRRAARRPGSST